MANRTAFIDFAQGLLNLNPLERWTPSQAKMHPFITQQKYTGPFVPPMGMRSGSSKSPAPGVQEQQRAEAMSKQRQQQAAAAQAQAQSAAYASMQMNSYPASPMSQQPPQNMYNMYSPGGHGQSAPPPPYQQQGVNPGYASQPPPPMGMMSAQQTPRYNQQPPPPNNLYAQATTRAGRQRASTLEQHNTGIPAALQRVMGHLDPNAPIRLQPSPAYYPPPPDGAPDAQGNRRRASRAGQQGQQGQRGNRDFIRNLEDRTLEEGFMQSNHWQ